MAVQTHYLGRIPRIAIVEDDRTMAMLLAYNFEAAGFDVIIVGAGAGAVDRLVETRPDVVLLDWELPGLSGIEVLRLLRAQLGSELPPTLMLTGRNDREDRQRAIGTGARGFVTKPFSMAELLHLVDRIMTPTDPAGLPNARCGAAPAVEYEAKFTLPHRP